MGMLLPYLYHVMIMTPSDSVSIEPRSLTDISGTFLCFAHGNMQEKEITPSAHGVSIPD
ncbi:MAG: hypothetical protein WB562_09310 [Candidatus Sulfotelmatobacter sp.]